ncbi:hypothetical protein KUTeg_016126 [Tegillarca granosa]|uniref:Uncharacterized protein n=1 Tax=Tegillarca granosa TaxID=220873 RepID=A0ABQ9EMG9_TEGGR|nr:hypothetical protein KUTeg_016126 [Tegillarca granosa]
MLKSFQVDSDSDASIGFLSLAVHSNKLDDEDIVIVDKKNEANSKLQLEEKSRLSVKPGEQLEKSEIAKPTKTERKKSRKKSSATVNVEDENVDEESKLKTKPSKLREEFEKEFDLISLESDESVLYKVTKNTQKGDKDKKVTRNRKSAIKKEGQEDKKTENVIVENKTKQKKGKKIKGKDEKEKSNLDRQGSNENESEKHVVNSENHLDSMEQENMGNNETGSLTKLQKSKLARKKSFMFDESEVESIQDINSSRNVEQIETEKQNDVDFDCSRMNSENLDENLQNRNASIQTKSRKNRRKISVPLSLPRQRQQKLATPKSLPPRKRKISAQVELQAKTRKSTLPERNNDKEGAIETLQKSRKMSLGQKDEKEETDKSQMGERKTNGVGKKASKRSQKPGTGKDETSATCTDENLNVSLEKKRKKAKASIAETPVSIRSQTEESPLPFEVSNIEQAFHSGVSFRHKSRISELNDSLQPNPMTSPVYSNS